MGKNRNKRQPRKQQARKKRRRQAATTNGMDFVKLFRWFLPNGRILAGIKRHGNIKWLPVHLVALALLWSFSESRTLTDGFAEAVESSQKLFGSGFSVLTYQGFMGALVTWTPSYMPLLRKVLQSRMEQIGGKYWRIDGWVPIAFDGSRSTAPRTAKNEAAYCAPNPGQSPKARAKSRRKKNKGLRKPAENPQPQEPQAWITLMWHMGLRLPWDWRLGPSNSSEREHVTDMVANGEFPNQTLFCGDAGFIGYAFWASLLRKGHFLVRAGANVHLLTEMAGCDFTKVGHAYSVLCWPKDAQNAGLPPLRLRLVQVLIGRTKMWMLTSVLDPKELTTKQIEQFYKFRWGVEIEFRGLKQTLDRDELRCRNPERLLVELDWSILAMAVAELFALEARVAKKSKAREYDPKKRSLAKTMRALRYCLRHLDEVPAPGKDLASQLAAARTDDYVRKSSKRSRYRPKNPDKKPLGDPKIRAIDAEEKAKLRKLKKDAKIRA